ncbi:MAG TPA: hypothetical protein VM754_09785 [Actinomycetota bacterium]|nr:hypothetical protein [Actinomycetota bacterium]
MKPDRQDSRIIRLVTTVLLSLVLSYAAGLAALAAFASRGPAVASRAVAIGFGITLVGLVALSLRPSAGPRQPEPEPDQAGGKTEGRGISAALLIGAVAASFLITYPRLGELGTLILGNTGDSGLNIYLLEWQIHASTQEIRSYFDTTIFAPERFTLFWGPSLIPLVPAYALAKLLTGNPIASFNLLMVGTTLATLLATFFFLRSAGFERLPAGLGGLLYATTGQRLAHLGHLDSIQTLWIPVFALLMLRAWDHNRVRHGLALGLALGCSLMTAPYYFLAGLGFVGVMVAVHLKSWRNLPWRSLTAAAGATLAIGGPILVMSRVAGLARSSDELVPTSWADFYHPGAFTPAMGWLARTAEMVGGGKSLENWLFPSAIMLLLATVGAWSWLGSQQNGRCPLPERRPDGLRSLLAAGAISGLVMGIGPHLRIGSHSIPLPMLAVMKLPGFDGARVTGRFVTPAFLALTVVALVGLQVTLRNVRKRVKPWFVVATAAAVLASTQAFYPAAALDVSGPPSAVNRELASRPQGLVVELPWPGCPGLGCLYTEPPRMIWSRYDWYPRLGGYSGYVPEYWEAAGRAFNGFPDPTSMEFLKSYNVGYVVLRVSAGEQGISFTGEQAAALATAARNTAGVERVDRVGNDYLVTLARQKPGDADPDPGLQTRQ